MAEDVTADQQADGCHALAKVARLTDLVTATQELAPLRSFAVVGLHLVEAAPRSLSRCLVLAQPLDECLTSGSPHSDACVSANGGSHYMHMGIGAYAAYILYVYVWVYVCNCM